jgi:trk system potassium uptake protein TrkA
MNFIVVGCGRVGAELSLRLCKSGHQVVVVDQDASAFNRLDSEFRGRTVEGEAVSEKVLERAGIAESNGLAAVTNSDTLNAAVAHTARVFYNVPVVVARNYDPTLRTMLEAFDLQTVSSSSWGAQKVEEILASLSARTVYSVGNGEVEVCEIVIPAEWDGHPLSKLLRHVKQCIPVALTRAGRSSLPSTDTRLQTSDILSVSTTFEGISALSARLAAGAEV